VTGDATTVAGPYEDHRQAGKKNTVDWLVTVRQGAVVNTMRFTDRADAVAFAVQAAALAADYERGEG
jgi:hypothetical protein